MQRRTLSTPILLVTLLLALSLSACGGTTAPSPAPTTEVLQSQPTAVSEAEEPMTDAGALPEVDPMMVEGDIVAAGSSTVFPLAEAMAERFTDEGYGGQITIDSIGSGAGFERFCVTAETDIATASRAIKEEETAACQGNGREPIEFRVGTDALAVVVSSENDFVDELSLEQLAQIFSGEAATWADVDPSFPAEPLQLYSPGTDSGTFDYFVEVVFDKEDGKILAAKNIQFSEDDNVLVQGVEGSPNAIGYFGYAYYQENADRLKILRIGGVEANDATAESGDYPLSRPLFLYSDGTVLKEKPQVAAYLSFFLSYVNEEIGDVGYFPASAEALQASRDALLAATE